MSSKTDGRSSSSLQSVRFSVKAERSPKRSNSPKQGRSSARFGLESGRSSPGHAPGEQDAETIRPIPIPPLVRISAPKGVTNGALSPNIAGPWRPASACDTCTTPRRRSHLPQSWSPTSDLTRSCSSKLFQGRQAGWDMSSLLVALGMPPAVVGEQMANNDGAKAFMQLPAFAPMNPQQCEEGCYWRWLTHALLEDVGELRRNLEEVQEEFRQRFDEKSEIEKKLSNHDRIVDELASMSRDLHEFHEKVPGLRDEHRNLQRELDNWQQMNQDLLRQNRALKDAIKRSVEWQKANLKKADTLENDAEEGKHRERVMNRQIAAAFEEFQQLESENKGLAAERDALRDEVSRLEASKGKKKKKGKSKGDKPKSKSPKR